VKKGSKFRVRPKRGQCIAQWLNGNVASKAVYLRSLCDVRQELRRTLSCCKSRDK